MTTVGTFWKYREAWSKTLYELVEDKPDMHGVIMRVTHNNGWTGKCFCTYLYLKNNLVQVTADDVITDSPIL